MKTKRCQTCGKTFKVYGDENRYDRAKFCSRQCLKERRNSRICFNPNCGKQFFCKPSESQKFCTKECRADYYENFFEGLPVRIGDRIICHSCKEYKLEHEFFNRKGGDEAKKRNGKTRKCKSCFLKINNHNREQHLSDVLGTLKVAWYRVRKRTENLTFNDVVDIYNSQAGKCKLSGIKMEATRDKIGSQRRNMKAISIDRIDSKIGYIKENIQLVCCAVNQMKNELSTEELIFWCKAIANN